MNRFAVWCWAWLLCGAFEARSAEKLLNLFIWSEYLDPQIVRDFEQAEKCRVVIDLYEDAESMLAKLQGGGGGLYDIAVPPDYMVPLMARLKLVAPLPRDRIPNFKNLDPQFTNPGFDPGNRFSIPYQWGTVGIFYRGTEREEVSWEMIFGPGKEKVVLIDSMRDLIGAALKFRSHSLNSTAPRELIEARDLILRAKVSAVGFDGSVGARNKVVEKLATAAIVYSGDAARAMVEAKEVHYGIPREGSQIWMDNLVILAKAPHTELAGRFLNYLLEPETGARLARFTKSGTPNRRARSLLPPEITNNPSIYPSAEAMRKLEFLTDLGSRTRLYDEIWTQIKSK